MVIAIAIYHAIAWHQSTATVHSVDERPVVGWAAAQMSTIASIRSIDF
jgi:hypothetical protein